MIEVALEVDHTWPLVQHALLEALLHRARHLAHVAVALAEIHVVADPDDLGQERDHVRRLAHGLAMGDLGFALVEVRHRQAEGVGGGGETEARAGGVVAKDGNRQPGVEHAERAPLLVQGGEQFGEEHHRAELVVGLLPGQQKILPVTVGLQRLQPGQLFLVCLHRMENQAADRRFR